MLGRRLARGLRGFSARKERVIELERRFACNPAGPMSEVARRAKGLEVEGLHGQKYLDCSGGEGAMLFGHLREDLVHAFTSALEHGGSCLGPQPLYHSICSRISRLAGLQETVLLPSDGNALDLLKAVVDRWACAARSIPAGESWLALSRQGAAGSSLLSCAASDDFRVRVGFGPFAPGFETVDADSLLALRRTLAANDRIAAFVLNPLPLRAGMRPPSEEYARGLGALCDEFRVLLAVDERGCGGGRTGAFCYSQLLGLRPDVVLLGSGLAAGFSSFGAMACREGLLPSLVPQTSDPAVLAVVNAALNVLEEPCFLQEVGRKGQLLLSLLQEGLKGAKSVCNVRGFGLMLCVQLWSFADFNEVDLTVKLARRGLLVSALSDHVFILPPLDLTFHDCHRIAEIVKEVFDEYY